jgi:thiamine biosynthesis lipoprotein
MAVMVLNAESLRLILPAVLAWGMALPVATATAPANATELTGRTMGTTYRIKYWGDGKPTRTEVHAKVEALLERFDSLMSTYRDDSELSRFNRAAPNEWFAVSAETAYVVKKAIEYHELTDGALDVTVAPLSRLWNFGPDAKRDTRHALPTDEQIAEAMKLVGAQRLRMRQEPPALWKEVAGVEVDLSAIAPGYAVDLVIERLKALAFDNAMVEIGGEVRGVGVRPDGQPWRIGVERAGAPTGSFVEVVGLADLAMTTAGDYRNVQGRGDARYTHIIDPRLGKALPYRGVSVTVLAETALEADALDTALVVMGASRGHQWCVEHDTAALFQSGGGAKVKTTPRFDQILEAAKASAGER